MSIRPAAEMLDSRSQNQRKVVNLPGVLRIPGDGHVAHVHRWSEIALLIGIGIALVHQSARVITTADVVGS